jgi:hypothetical protein
VVKVKHFRPFFGNDVDICLYEKRLVLPVKFAQPSLDAVSDNGVAHLLAHSETQAGTACRILPEQKEVRRVHFQGTRVELQKLGALAQAFTFGEN